MSIDQSFSPIHMFPIAPKYAAGVSLLLFGAGGHGRVVAEAAWLGKKWSCIVASDRNPAVCSGELLPGIAMLDISLAQSLNFPIHVAVGNNLARLHEARLWGHERLISVIHPASMVSHFSSVGLGCYVAAGAVIGPGAAVGVGAIINHGVVVDHDVQVGAFSHIAPNATLGGGVEIGQRVLVGSGAVVLPALVIADDVIVGAGAVVTTDLKEPGSYAGIPARRIK